MKIRKGEDILLEEFKDLTGMTFNHLTVIEYAGRKNKNNVRYWLCECDCENKTRKEISEKNLKNGNTKSCGCSRRKTTEEYKKELEEINKKNGTNIRLKVGVKYIDNKIKISHICTCGKEWDVSPNSILSGNIKNCNLCYTFKQWCLNNNKQDVLSRWDYELNDYNPSEISYGSGEKYYFKCSRGIHESELKKISAFTSGQEGSVRCNQCNSFKQWCLDNNKEDVLNRWDYSLNDCKPNKISYSTHKNYYFKCPKGIHKSELKNINHFTTGYEGSIKCNACNSFAQWGLDNLGEDFLEKYWDYEKNTVDPWEINKGSNKHKVWIYCQEKDYHGSYDVTCSSFILGGRCSYCRGISKVHPKDSFAQYLIDTYENNALKLYWDYNKNIIDPWKISRCSNHDIHIFCQEKDYHGSYPTKCDIFIRGVRCPFCHNTHGKVHLLDSLGTLRPESLKVWSDNNKKSPYEYSPKSEQQVYWKCPDNKHEDFPRSIKASNRYNFRCPECQYSKGEERISNCFISNNFIKIDQNDFDQLVDKDKYSKNYYIPQKTFYRLIGLGGDLLLYDFYIPYLNLLIEYHGGQHEKFTRGIHKTIKDFEYQLEHDNRKCIYADNNNIKLLIIWYWDFDNIEKILEREVFNK